MHIRITDSLPARLRPISSMPDLRRARSFIGQQREEALGQPCAPQAAGRACLSSCAHAFLASQQAAAARTSSLKPAPRAPQSPFGTPQQARVASPVRPPLQDSSSSTHPQLLHSPQGSLASAPSPPPRCPTAVQRPPPSGLPACDCAQQRSSATDGTHQLTP